MTALRLAGKIALVTGASRGIGRAIALRFAREGANLVLGYRERTELAAEVEELCRAEGRDAYAVRADLASPEAPGVLCQAALERFGALHILVNNAARASEELVATLADDELEELVALNVLGLVRLTRAALRPMIRQRHGCIINLSSVAARRPGRGSAVYAGSKGFVESFTRALAVEVGRKGIRVCAVAPGVVETEMTRAVRALAEDRILEKIALGRYGRPEEVAALCAHLASDEGAYITGATLPVDGAFHGS